jgi:hypothetical protein
MRGRGRDHARQRGITWTMQAGRHQLDSSVDELGAWPWKHMKRQPDAQLTNDKARRVDHARSRATTVPSAWTARRAKQASPIHSRPSADEEGVCVCPDLS